MPIKRNFSSLGGNEHAAGGAHRGPAKKQKVQHQQQATPKPATGGNGSGAANGSKPAKQKKTSNSRPNGSPQHSGHNKQMSRPSPGSSAAPPPRSTHAQTPAKQAGVVPSSSRQGAISGSRATVPGQPSVLEAPEGLSKSAARKWRKQQRESLGEHVTSSPAAPVSTPTMASKLHIPQQRRAVVKRGHPEVAMPPPPPPDRPAPIQSSMPAKRTASDQHGDKRPSNASNAVGNGPLTTHGRIAVRRADPEMLRKAASTALALPPKKQWIYTEVHAPQQVPPPPRRTADASCQTELPSSDVLSSTNLDLYVKAMKHVLETMGVEQVIGASDEVFKERIARSLSSMSPTLLRRPSTSGTQQGVNGLAAGHFADAPVTSNAMEMLAPAPALDGDEDESDEPDDSSDESGQSSDDSVRDDGIEKSSEPNGTGKALPSASAQQAQAQPNEERIHQNDVGEDSADEGSESSGESFEGNAVPVSAVDTVTQAPSVRYDAKSHEVVAAVDQGDAESDSSVDSSDEEESESAGESGGDEIEKEAPDAQIVTKAVPSSPGTGRDKTDRQVETKSSPDEGMGDLPQSDSLAHTKSTLANDTDTKSKDANGTTVAVSAATARFPSFNDTLRSFPRSSVLSSRSLFSPKPPAAPSVARSEDRAKAYQRFTAFTGGDDSSDDDSSGSESDDEAEQTKANGSSRTIPAVVNAPSMSLRELNNARASQQLAEEADAAARTPLQAHSQQAQAATPRDEATSKDVSSEDEGESATSESDEEGHDSDASESDDDDDDAGIPKASARDQARDGLGAPPQVDGAVDDEAGDGDEPSDMSVDEDEDEDKSGGHENGHVPSTSRSQPAYETDGQDSIRSKGEEQSGKGSLDALLANGRRAREAAAMPEGMGGAGIMDGSEDASHSESEDEDESESSEEDTDGLSEPGDNSNSVKIGAATLADQIEVPETTQEDAEAISDGYSEDDDEMEDVPARSSRRTSDEVSSDRITASVSPSLPRKSGLSKAALQDNDTTDLRQPHPVTDLIGQSNDAAKIRSEASFLGQRRGFTTGSRRARDSELAILHDSPMKSISFKDTDSNVDKTIEEIEHEVFGSIKALPPGKPHDPDEDKENHLTNDDRLIHIASKGVRQRILKDDRIPMSVSEPFQVHAVLVPESQPESMLPSSQRPPVARTMAVTSATPSPLRRRRSDSSLSDLGPTPSPPPELLNRTQALSSALSTRVQEANAPQPSSESNTPLVKKRKMTGMTSKHFTPEKPRKQRRQKSKAPADTAHPAEDLKNDGEGSLNPTVEAPDAVPSTPGADPACATISKRPRAKRKTTGKKSNHFLPLHLLDRVDIPSPNKKPGRVPAGVSVAPVPPISSSRFGIIQEKLWDQPFWLLIAVTFLNKTRGQVAAPIFWRLKERYPTPADLAQADFDDIFEMIQCLGFQTQRGNRLINMAKMWEQCQPEKGKRYKSKNYPNKGDHAEYNRKAVIEGDVQSAKGANEIAHMPGCGAYAWDSWRIFCRDVLRGQAEDYNGKNALLADFEPEWKRVIPDDKELRATLRWMWLREGWIWDHHTGEKRRADEEEMERARKGEMDVPDVAEKKFAAQAVGAETPKNAFAVGVDAVKDET